MDYTGYQKGHNLNLVNRKHGNLTGIKEVISFDTDLVELATEQGMLSIKGNDLRVIRLDVDKGELEMSGRIDSLSYSELKSPKELTTGVLKRLFK